MVGAGGDEAVDDGDQECPCPARRLQNTAGAEVRIRRVPDQVEDQLDDPSAGEDLAVVGPRVADELSEIHGFPDK